MKILCVFGEHNYGNPARGQGYEYTNFLPALRNLGHEVQFFESFNRSHYADFTELNRALLAEVEQFRPDLVFCVLMGYEIWLETFALIRQSGTRLLSWGTDDSWKYRQFSRYLAPAFDVWVTTSHRAWQDSKRDGHRNVVLSQWAARGDALAEPLASIECRYPVSFVGSSYGNRPRWVAELQRRGIAVSCFGHGWPSGAVKSEDIPRIVLESVVSLNFGDSGWHIQGLRFYRSRQIKARVFEVPGAGGCLLTEGAEHLEDYYRPGVENEIFQGMDDLEKKIRHLLESPSYRDEMARAGYRRTASDHTYEARFKGLLAQFSAVERRESIDFSHFEHIAVRHRAGVGLRALRAILAAPFILFFGRRRGLRAARRVLLEFSWRLCGRRTYTVAGLPGRLFYAES